MAAIDNLTAAITALSTTIDSAVTRLTTPPASETAIQSAADAVTAQNAKLVAALTPPTPPAA